MFGVPKRSVCSMWMPKLKALKSHFFLLLTHLDFWLFLIAVIQLSLSCMQRRMSFPLLVLPMTLDEEAEFGDEDDDEEGASKGKSAAVALKPTRHDHRAQASSVAGTASSTVANKAPSKKLSRKQIFLSDDESTTDEKTLTIQMQHTINRGSSTAAGHTVDAVKSLFDEVKTRKNLISQL